MGSQQGTIMTQASFLLPVFFSYLSMYDNKFSVCCYVLDSTSLIFGVNWTILGNHKSQAEVWESYSKTIRLCTVETKRKMTENELVLFSALLLNGEKQKWTTDGRVSLWNLVVKQTVLSVDDNATLIFSNLSTLI